MRRGNWASWPYMTLAACKSEAQMVRGGLGTRPRVGLSTTAKIYDTGGPAVRNLGRESRRSGGAARAED